MRITEATLFALKIPFIESFRHSTKTRTSSDSIVVRVVSDDGTIGYGEGVARPYVTGETVEACLDHMKRQLWPRIAGMDFTEMNPDLDPLSSFAAIDRLLDEPGVVNVVAWNGARAAFELALIDCLLRKQELSLGAILPPKRQNLVYSGAITSSSEEKTVQIVKYLKLFGIKQIKVKIGTGQDKSRLVAIREMMGPSCSLRVDANGAFSSDKALAVLREIQEVNVEYVEQPIPRGDALDLAKLRTESPIPIMVDESLVTLDDAQQLITARACDAFNLRVSKCGGIGRTLEMARMAADAGIAIQLGSQVGETAILSAAGRHVAAYLDDPKYLEGSFGTMLLVEDVGKVPVQFGHGGKAPVLRGLGLGVTVQEEVLKKYAEQVIHC